MEQQCCKGRMNSADLLDSFSVRQKDAFGRILRSWQFLKWTLLHHVYPGASYAAVFFDFQTYKCLISTNHKYKINHRKLNKQWVQISQSKYMLSNLLFKMIIWKKTEKKHKTRQNCSKTCYTAGNQQRAAVVRSESHSRELNYPEFSGLINLDCLHLPGRLLKPSTCSNPLSHLCGGVTGIGCQGFVWVQWNHKRRI